MQNKKMLAMAVALAVGLAGTALLAGCGGKPGQKAPQAVAVKAMQPLKQDTLVTHEFVGEVQAKEEVQIRARVSGNIVEKMIEGGATVSKGQPLFRIDSRTYESAVWAARANLAEAEASLSRSRRDVARYEQLAKQQAVSQQVLDNAVAEASQLEARVAASRANLVSASLNAEDTLIVSPIDGRIMIDAKDMSVGNYVVAGTTTLATVSSVDPVQVRFSMSENEYLQFAKLGQSGSGAAWGKKLQLLLSDGSKYKEIGQVDQVDRGLSQETGTLVVKAGFANPDRILVPGMFARIVAEGEVRQGATLVPQRAVQELLGKTFVTVVTSDGKAETRPVKFGPRVGQFWIAEEGVTEADTIVVEGFQKAQPGAALQVTMVGAEALNTGAAR